MRYLSWIVALLFAGASYGQHTILWKLVSPVSKRTSYVLGTYHLFGESFVDSLPVIKEKLQAVDMVITETQMDRAKAVAYYNSRPPSDTLYSILSREDADFIAGLFKNGQVDISRFTPGELFAKLQAFYPKYKCEVIARGDKMSMDEYIDQLGSRQQKSLYYLETDSFQLDKLQQATRMYDWNFFKRNIPAVLARYRGPTPDKKQCEMIVQYAALDINYRFGTGCNVLKNSTANEALIKKRNEDWMQKLPPLLEHNDCFIAVGIAHLYNQCGLLEQLRKLGYTVEPVVMNK